jgi:two-component system, NarL family, sensor histidine kinase UhpB
LPFAKPSSISPVLLVVALASAALICVAGLAFNSDTVAFGGLAAAVAAAGALGVYLVQSERRRGEEAVAEAKEREAERARMSDLVVTAEQEERRRLALFLHDGPVQSLSGIALMLDAVAAAVESGRLDEARSVLPQVLQRQRDTIRSLRDLSFNLEPVVLRDQGFGPAVAALAEQLGLAEEIQITLDVQDAEQLAQRAQVTLYQIIREALHNALRRKPSKIAVRIKYVDGSVETVISDNGAGERRRATYDSLAERARALNAELSVDSSEDGGTSVRVLLPDYAARR